MSFQKNQWPAEVSCLRTLWGKLNEDLGGYYEENENVKQDIRGLRWTPKSGSPVEFPIRSTGRIAENSEFWNL